MWQPGDSFVVNSNGLPGATVGKTYTITTSFQLFNGNKYIKYYTYVGDDRNFYDAEESVFFASVYKPLNMNFMTGVFNQSNSNNSQWHRAGDWLDIEFSPSPYLKRRCTCGSKAVGVKDDDLDRHQTYCMLLTGKE